MSIRATAGMVAGLAALVAATGATAGGTHAGGHDDAAAIGHAGDPAQVDRTIEVEMGEMFFAPESIEVQKGETIRFLVANTGRMVHEFSLGTEAMHDAHLEEMKAMMRDGMMTASRIRHDRMMAAGMMHDDPNSVLLEPGETAEIVWTFDAAGELMIACNVPGHRPGGMVGTIGVTDGRS